MNINCHVVAKYVNKSQVTFECPFCYTRYKKNGDPAKSAKNATHVHTNSKGTTENQIFTRVPACGKRFPRQEFVEFEIAVTDDTKRVGDKKRKSTARRQ